MEATQEEQSWIMLSENLQRKDLSEVEKAEEIYEIRTRFDGSNVQLGRKLGVTEAYIRYLLSLANFPEPVKAMVKSEEVSAKSLRPLAQLGSKESPVTPLVQVKVAKHIRDNHLNYDGAKEVVQRVNELPPEVRETLDVPDIKVSEGVNVAIQFWNAKTGLRDSVYTKVTYTERNFAPSTLNLLVLMLRPLETLNHKTAEYNSEIASTN